MEQIQLASTGNVGGSTANATLSTAQLASHITLQRAQMLGNTQVHSRPIALGTTNTGNAGSGQGHSHNMSANFSGTAANPSVLQPYLTIIYIIKT